MGKKTRRPPGPAKVTRREAGWRTLKYAPTAAAKTVKVYDGAGPRPRMGPVPSSRGRRYREPLPIGGTYTHAHMQGNRLLTITVLLMSSTCSFSIGDLHWASPGLQPGFPTAATSCPLRSRPSPTNKIAVPPWDFIPQRWRNSANDGAISGMDLAANPSDSISACFTQSIFR
jgi:hypothetical protein